MASLEKQVRIKTRIENSFINFKKLGSANMSKGACESRMAQLDKLWTEFEEAYETLVNDEDTHKGDEYFENDVFSVVEEAYLYRLGLFKEYLSRFDTPVNPADAPTVAARGRIDELWSSQTPQYRTTYLLGRN